MSFAAVRAKYFVPSFTPADASAGCVLDGLTPMICLGCESVRNRHRNVRDDRTDEADDTRIGEGGKRRLRHFGVERGVLDREFQFVAERTPGVVDVRNRLLDGALMLVCHRFEEAGRRERQESTDVNRFRIDLPTETPREGAGRDEGPTGETHISSPRQVIVHMLLWMGKTRIGVSVRTPNPIIEPRYRRTQMGI